MNKLANLVIRHKFVIFTLILILVLISTIYNKTITTKHSSQPLLINCVGSSPTSCNSGYICQHPKTPGFITDPSIGDCIRLVLNKEYTIGSSPISWNNPPEVLTYLDENLKVVVLGFDDECEKYNKNQNLNGCVNAGQITWNFKAQKDDQEAMFSITAEREKSQSKEVLGYIFQLNQINRFSSNLIVLNEK